MYIVHGLEKLPCGLQCCIDHNQGIPLWEGPSQLLSRSISPSTLHCVSLQYASLRAGLTLFAILFHKYRHHSGGNTSTNTSTNKTKCNQSQSISISALCHIKQILHTHRITVHVQLNFQFQQKLYICGQITTVMRDMMTMTITITPAEIPLQLQ